MSIQETAILERIQDTFEEASENCENGYVRRAHLAVDRLLTTDIPLSDQQRRRVHNKLAEIRQLSLEQVQAINNELERLHTQVKSRMISYDEYQHQATIQFEWWKNAILTEDGSDKTYKRAYEDFQHNLDDLQIYEKYLEVQREYEQMWERGRIAEQDSNIAKAVIVDEYYRKARDHVKEYGERYPTSIEFRRLLDEANERLQQKNQEFVIRSSFQLEGLWDEMLALYEDKADDEYDDLLDEKGNVTRRARVSEIRKRVVEMAEQWAAQKAIEGRQTALYLLCLGKNKHGEDNEEDPSPQAAKAALSDAPKWQKWLREKIDIQNLERIINQVQEQVDLQTEAEKHLNLARVNAQEGHLDEAWTAYEMAFRTYRYVPRMRNVRDTILEGASQSLKVIFEEGLRRYEKLQLEEAITYFDTKLKLYPATMLEQRELSDEIAEIQSLKEKISNTRAHLRELPNRLSDLRTSSARNPEQAARELLNLEESFADTLHLLEDNQASFKSLWAQYEEVYQLVRRSQGAQEQMRYLEKKLQENDLREIRSAIHLAEEALKNPEYDRYKTEFDRLVHHLMGRECFINGRFLFDDGQFDSAEAQLIKVRDLYPENARMADELLTDITRKRAEEDVASMRLEDAKRSLSIDPRRAWEQSKNLQFVNRKLRNEQEDLIIRSMMLWLSRIEDRLRDVQQKTSVSREDARQIHQDLNDLQNHLAVQDPDAYGRWSNKIRPILSISEAENARTLDEAIELWQRAIDDAYTQDQVNYAHERLRRSSLRRVQARVESILGGGATKDNIQDVLQELNGTIERWEDAYEPYFWRSQMLLLLSASPENRTAREKEGYARDAYQAIQLAHQKFLGRGREREGDEIYSRQIQQQLKSAKALQDLLPELVKIEEWVRPDRTVEDLQRAIKLWRDQTESVSNLPALPDWWRGIVTRVEEEQRRLLPPLETRSLDYTQVSALAKVLLLFPQDEHGLRLLRLVPNQARSLHDDAIALEQRLENYQNYRGNDGFELLRNQLKDITQLQEHTKTLRKIAVLFRDFQLIDSGNITIGEAISDYLQRAEQILQGNYEHYQQFLHLAGRVQEGIDQGMSNPGYWQDAEMQLRMIPPHFAHHRLAEELREKLQRARLGRQYIEEQVQLFMMYMNDERYDLAAQMIEWINQNEDLLDEYNIELEFRPRWRNELPCESLNEIREFLARFTPPLLVMFDWGRSIGPEDETGIPGGYDSITNWGMYEQELRRLSAEGAFNRVHSLFSYLTNPLGDDADEKSFYDAIQYLRAPCVAMPNPDEPVKPPHISWDAYWQHLGIHTVNERYQFAGERAGSTFGLEILRYAFHRLTFYEDLIKKLRPDGELYAQYLTNIRHRYEEQYTTFVSTIAEINELLATPRWDRNPRIRERALKLVETADAALRMMYDPQVGLCPRHSAAEPDRANPSLIEAKMRLR